MTAEQRAKATVDEWNSSGASAAIIFDEEAQELTRYVADALTAHAQDIRAEAQKELEEAKQSAVANSCQVARLVSAFNRALKPNSLSAYIIRKAIRETPLEAYHDAQAALEGIKQAEAQLSSARQSRKRLVWALRKYSRELSIALVEWTRLGKLERAAITMLRRSIVESVPNANGKGRHVEMTTDHEAWKEFFDLIPAEALSAQGERE